MIWLTFACQSLDTPRQPDVLLIVVDTLRADVLENESKHPAAVKNIRELAQSGTSFTRAYAQSSWTLPSFMSLWTGQYAYEHRVGRSPTDEDLFGRLPDETLTLAERFKSQGYQTGAVINNTFLAPSFGAHQGFDTYLYEGADNSNLRSASQTTAEAINWLSNSDGPRFLVVHYMEPHMHLQPPSHVRGTLIPPESTTIPVPYMTVHADKLTKNKSLQTPDTIAQIKSLYSEEIMAVDMAIGDLVASYRESSSAENYIFLTADHGEEFWDHGQFEHGHSLLSEVIAVPLIAVGPGFTKNKRSSVIVEHVDLHRTLAQKAGLALSPSIRGTDLEKLAAVDSSTIRWSIAENTLYGDPLLGLTTPMYRLVLNQKDKSFKVWALDEAGKEMSVLSPEDQERVGLPLLNALSGIRGDLLPIESVPGLKVPDQQMFQQLKDLGYIDR